MQHQAADPEVARLCARTAEFIVGGRLTAARPLVAALRRTAPNSVRIRELSAALAMRRGELVAARAELDAAVSAWPEDCGLRIQRAALGRLEGNRAAALEDAADAVMLDPGQPFAKAMLGTLLRELGQGRDATACLAESVAALPANTLFRLSLADAQAGSGEVDAARGTLAEGIRCAPRDIGCRKAAILMEIQNDDYAAAVRLADEAREAGLVDAVTMGLAGHALSKLGRHEAAAPYYAEARKLGPDDAYVRHLVAAAGGIRPPVTASPDYVSAVFDGYAPTFEAHLATLGYRVPWHIRAALLRHCPALAAGEPIGPVLDLGCGTGLMAAALKGLPAGPITGVDLSRLMLDRAAAKGLYGDLHHAEVGAFLDQDTGSYALVLAADMFCYQGDLHPLLRRIGSRLAPGGLCAFSVEQLDDDDVDGVDAGGWALGRQGRYRHAARHVTDSVEAVGLAMLELHEVALREEDNTPVRGLIALCRAP